MMNKKKFLAKGFLRNLAVMLTLVLVLGMTLTGCGGGVQTIEVDIDDDLYDQNVNSLTKNELDDIATLAANNLSIREQLTAAYRGYDMTAEGFDDDKLGEAATDEAKKVEFAVNVIKAATKDMKDFDADLEKLNFADLTTLIKGLQVEVNVEVQNGFFDQIQYWIGIGLKAITNTVGFGNYIVGICIFAIIVEVLMIPFSIKQQKNSIRQAKLRPKEMAIRNKYKGRNDQATQQKVNQEIQELYQRENFSPASGCLPLLIQLPIIMVLYNIVVDPLRYVLGRAGDISTALSSYFTTAKAAGGLGGSLQTNGRGTIEIVSMIKEKGMDAFEGLKDFLYFKGDSGTKCFDSIQEIAEEIPSFNIGSLNLGLTPSFTDFSWLLLIPVLTFVVYFFSMKLTRKFTYQATTAQDQAMGCSNNMMDLMMPLFSVYITFIVPAAVGAYWIFKSILSTIKQFILHKVMPTPVFTEADYKAAEKEYNSKNPSRPRSSGSASANGERPRSLHYIDADDDETPAPAVKKESKELPEPEEKPAETTEGSAEATEEASAEKANEGKDEKKKKGFGLLGKAPLKKDTKDSDSSEKKN